MLPDKVIAERNRIKQLGKECLKKYLIPENSYQHFVLVAIPFLYDEFMTVVGEMSGEELSEDDWWVKGFRPVKTSAQYPQHRELIRLCHDIALEIWAE